LVIKQESPQPRRQLLHFINLAGEALGSDAGRVGAEGVGERAVIPQGPALAAGEAAPYHLRRDRAQIGVDRAGVVGLVGEAHREAAGGLVGEAGDIGLLARVPGGLGLFVASVQSATICATPSPKAGADRFELGEAALILDRIVEQRGNRLILVRPVLERDGGDSEEVRDIGNRRCPCGSGRGGVRWHRPAPRRNAR
jgi:hypothetical protein